LKSEKKFWESALMEAGAAEDEPPWNTFTVFVLPALMTLCTMVLALLSICTPPGKVEKKLLELDEMGLTDVLEELELRDEALLEELSDEEEGLSELLLDDELELELLEELSDEEERLDELLSEESLLRLELLEDDDEDERLDDTDERLELLPVSTDVLDELSDDDMLEPVLESEELLLSTEDKEEDERSEPVLERDELRLEELVRDEDPDPVATQAPSVSPCPRWPGTAASGTSMVVAL
jgi:hypothetical protein